ncbi:hypothetical protein SLE2022_072010 [Rubroshorea leprosula]
MAISALTVLRLSPLRTLMSSVNTSGRSSQQKDALMAPELAFSSSLASWSTVISSTSVGTGKALLISAASLLRSFTCSIALPNKAALSICTKEGGK